MNDVYCYAEKVPSTNLNDTFEDSYIEHATLYVPDASINLYKAAKPWNNFKEIVGLNGTSMQKCEKPIISYENGLLKFASATDGVEFVADITDTDIKKHYDATISLTASAALVGTSIQPGNVAIVKVGDKYVKVAVF